MDDIRAMEKKILEEGACPVCGDTINESGLEIDGDHVMLIYRCACDTQWVEIYDLASAELKRVSGVPIPVHYGLEVKDVYRG